MSAFGVRLWLVQTVFGSAVAFGLLRVGAPLWLWVVVVVWGCLNALSGWSVER